MVSRTNMSVSMVMVRLMEIARKKQADERFFDEVLQVYCWGVHRDHCV